MGNSLAARGLTGLTVYAMDHRGFGRSGGVPAHIDDYHTFIEDIHFVVTEIRRRHPDASIYVLGHSMGGIFATYFAAKYGEMLAGVLLLNPWVEDTTRLPFLTTLAILVEGLFKSKHYWQVAPGTEKMTTNAEAVQMLQADPYWRRQQTASFLFQLFLMRSGILNEAKRVTMPALVMQAEADKSVVVGAARRLYETLASGDKTWKTYSGYDHDSEFEPDRSQMDGDVVAWIGEHAAATSQASRH
jgi:alpha-beta hydrolase superfamily lysophospholipase